MLLSRRLPGILYANRCAAYSAMILLGTFVYILFKWNVVCVNLQAWQHVKKMCRLHEKGLAVGSLCTPLCVTKDIHSLTCHSFEATKEAVFSAVWHDIRLVFKSVSENTRSIHWYDNGVLKYPTEREFMIAIRSIAKNRLNLTLAYETVVRLSRLKPSYEEKRKELRQREMDALWLLLQDNEYLLSALFTDKDVFPQLLGTCGPYFAVEYLEPLPTASSSSLLTVYDGRESWGQRLRVAVQILELLDELETGFREPFHLCDLKLRHFGTVHDGRKLKFLDLDGVLPRSVAGSVVRDAAASCETDDDCDFYDCRSRCDVRAKKCLDHVTNDNLQMVCEKIFLGWRMSNTVIVPGLLVSQHTPADLASILRQCAHPEGGAAKARTVPEADIKKRLYSVLTEMEQAVNNDFFLNE